MMTDCTTLRGLLEHHVKTLHLKPDASFPSELKDQKDFIKSWQRAQQHSTLKAVQDYGPDHDCDGCWGSSDNDSDSLSGAQQMNYCSKREGSTRSIDPQQE